MTKLSIAFIALFSMSAMNGKSQTTMKTEETIKQVIETFVEAGEKRELNMYNGILHKDFRVIANRYPSPDKTSIIDRETYISLIEKKIIGGAHYTVIFEDMIVSNHSATATVKLKGDKGGQNITFLMVQNNTGDWQIITDMAVQTK